MASSKQPQDEAELRAAAAEKELEGFVYSVSHDLRSPIRSILSGAMILEEDFGERLPAGAVDEIQRIKRSAQKMSGLVDALLRYSRLAHQEMNIGQVDLSELARAIAESLQRRQDRLEVSIASDIKLTGDAALTNTVLEELMMNSVKFGATEIQVEPFGDGFAVRDNGAGFSGEQAERIFLPFEKLNGEDHAGFGMGLALVRRAVARQGGKIRAESAPGSGTTFFVRMAPGPAK